MNYQFHRNLNRMALFTAIIAAGIVLFHKEFLAIAITNIWLNGIIIGATVFGIGLCFSDIFKLLPEYRWLKKFFRCNKNCHPGQSEAVTRDQLPPMLLRPVAMILQGGKAKSISPNTLSNFLDMILLRFEDQRESVRYITNTLIFLGLLGTFWGLIHTIGGFAELIGNLNFDDIYIMNKLQAGLNRPLSGMGIAFTSSLFGLAGSLIVGFLGLQVQLAQNAIFRELEDNLAMRAELSDERQSIENATMELTKAVHRLEKTVAKL